MLSLTISQDSNTLSLPGNNGDTIIQPTKLLSMLVKNVDTIVRPTNSLSIEKGWGFNDGSST